MIGDGRRAVFVDCVRRLDDHGLHGRVHKSRVLDNCVLDDRGIHWCRLYALPDCRASRCS